MTSTCFLTPQKPTDNISKIMGVGLKRNGLNERWNTSFSLAEEDYMVGFSWCYEDVSEGIVILLEISKYYEGEMKKRTPPKLTKQEIIQHAKNFKKYIESDLSIVEMTPPLNPVTLSVQYELGNGIVSPVKKESSQNPFSTKPLSEIRIYYPKEFKNESIEACKMLAGSLKSFGLTGTIKTVVYSEQLPESDDNLFECVIIPPDLEDDNAKTLIETLRKRKTGIHVFDFAKSNNQYKFGNLTAGILYNSGSELWRVQGLAESNSLYVGIDLGHEHIKGKRRRSKVCMAFVDNNGRELAKHRLVIDNLALNEKQKLTNLLIKKLLEIYKEFEFDNVVIHKDGRILENHKNLYGALKKKFNSVSLVEVVKSNSAFILDPESKPGDIFDFGSFILLQTLPFSHLGKCTTPLKIKISIADLDRNLLVDNVFRLSKAFCGDSLFADKKLPVTTHIADKFSSFQIGKTLQSFNIEKKFTPNVN